MSGSRRRTAAGLLLLGLFLLDCFPTALYAHPLSPALLELVENEGHTVAVRWKTSAVRLPGAAYQPVLPAHCQAAGEPSVEHDGGAMVQRWTVDCGSRGLVGATVGVDGLAAARIDALLRVVLRDGRVIQTVLRAAQPSMIVPPGPNRLVVAGRFLRLGVDHIASGIDHLLFVFGLLLLVQAARPLAATITAFTMGHSLTLAAVVLGYARVDQRWVELAIACSILVLALELSRKDDLANHLLRRRPWVVAFAFGLLHGAGFASALAEAGLPLGEIPLALFSFNAGIEAGQFAFVVLVLAGRTLLGRVLKRGPSWMPWVPRYVLGTMAVYWCLERAWVIII